jgi:hypothetical protein
MKKIFLTITTIVFLGSGFYFYNIYLNKTAFHNQAGELFSTSKPINKKVDLKELQNLPKPVQVYFNNVLKDGSDYISYLRLIHKGAFKASVKSSWSSIHGVSYISTQTPAFTWQARIPMMVATENYIGNKGSTTVSLLDFITFSQKEGYEYNKREFTRWLAWALLYPTALLPNEMIAWEAVNDTRAKLIAKHNNLKVSFDVTFKDGMIKSLSSNRFMGEQGFKKWIVEVENYQWFDNYKIPTRIKSSWRLDNQIFSYTNYLITKAEFNKPVIF